MADLKILFYLKGSNELNKDSEGYEKSCDLQLS